MEVGFMKEVLCLNRSWFNISHHIPCRLTTSNE